jgi:5'-3' exonuclease
VNIHLVDGTYELFRHYFAVPSARDADGAEIGAVRAVVGSVLGMINRGATHVGVATDHVIESFRNRLWRGYKTSAGVPADLLSQFEPLEEALRLLGVAVWPMVEFEADDALAAAAEIAAADARVERVIICTPDKDLAQAVRGTRVVQLNRRTRVTFDEAGIIAKFGVPPASIPDYLALVGDSADGYPGLRGWGAKSAAAVLAVYGSLEKIPPQASKWEVPSLRGAPVLAATLRDHWDEVQLYRSLARLRTTADGVTIPQENANELEWRGTPRARWEAFCDEWGLTRLRSRPHRWLEN